MNFNDPIVRQRIIEHILFATEAVNAVKQQSNKEPEIEMIVQAIQTNLALTVLNFTLALDYRLKNSLTGKAEGLE